MALRIAEKAIERDYGKIFHVLFLDKEQDPGLMAGNERRLQRSKGITNSSSMSNYRMRRESGTIKSSVFHQYPLSFHQE